MIDEGPAADAAAERTRERRYRKRQDRPRQRLDAGLDRAVALHLREVLDDHEERSEHGEVEGEPGAVRGCEAGAAEEAERQHRRGRAPLLRDECGEQRDADGVGAERGSRRPAIRVAARRGPHDAEQAAAREHEAAEVERHLRAAALGQAARHEQCGREADGDVDPEDPVPVEPLHEHASEQRSERDAEAGDRRPEAERGGAALGREGGREQRQRERHEQSGAESLHGARDHELRQVRRQGAGRGGRCEHQEAGDQHAPAAVAVAECGSREDEDGEDEDVCVDDPLQAIERDAQVALHRRQRRDHDQVVEGDHEERGAGQGDGPDVSGAGGHEILRHVR